MYVTLTLLVHHVNSVVDPEGFIQPPPPPPPPLSPFETKIFYLHGEFSEKSGKINENQVKLTN